MAKQKSTKRPPTAGENPDWLLRDPEGGPPPPPVVTRATELPFTDLQWRDFERLCRRLAERDGNVEHVLTYGTLGQAQYGIDILVRLADGTYEVWQSKRYKKISPSVVRAATDLFLAHRWASQAKKFVLAVACNLDSTGVVEAIEDARDRLLAKSIAFEPIDASEFSKRLIAEPEIVDDYFGRPWAEAICPPEAREMLARRLSRFGLEDLRRALSDWYTSWVSTVDPGLPIADLGRSGRAAAAIPIGERYIRPNILVRIAEPAPQTASSGDQGLKASANHISGRGASEVPRGDNEHPDSTRTSAPTIREQRVELDRFLSSEARAVIAADAGMGKSTLLRVIALDLLADVPQFAVARDKYAKFLPVWVPFALWTRMASEQAAPPSLEELVAKFFGAQSEPKLAEEVSKAFASAKVLLLVDGLDEASDPTAARTVAAVLAAFAESRDVPVLVTSRPHGLQAMGGLAGTWARVELAPLSDAQRHALAKLWFRAIAELEGDEQPDSERVEAQAERRASSLTSALKRSPGIARLSQTPLFLLALMQLHRHGQELPRSRFAAIEKIIEQLVEHQPRRRETEALSTVSSGGMHQRQRDRVLDDFAFALHAGEMRGPVTEAADEEDAVARASSIVMQRQGIEDQDRAEEVARSVFAFAEERAGLLVKKASQAIGFLHLSIQEFLAARHLAQRSFSERIEFIAEHAEQSRWREPILYLLYLEKNEAQVGELVRAIEGARTTTVHGSQIRDTLLIVAVFSDLAHDNSVARGIAKSLLDAAELTGWGEQQRYALVSAVDGLASETVAELCRSRIGLWLPNRHGYGRASALYAMAHWPSAMHGACRTVLLRSLSADEEPTWQAAAEVLPLLATSDEATKNDLKALLKAAPSKSVIVSALYALGCGWADHPDVGELAAEARAASDPSIAMEGIRIRAQRNETDDKDFERFLELTYSERSFFGQMTGRRMIEHFAETRRTDFVERLAAKIDQERARNPHDLMPLIGSLILCDPQHPLVTPGISDLLDHDWNMRQIFAESGFPTDKILWNPELVAKIQNFATKENAKLHDYELYWISKILPETWLKEQVLSNLAGESYFQLWSARALVEVWGGDDPEVRQALLKIVDQGGEKVSSVAEMLPAVFDDKQACRAAFLRALKAKPKRVDFIVDGFRQLGVSPDDDETFEACLKAGSHVSGGTVYQDLWREQMILTFPDRAIIREMARKELHARNGAVGAIAKSYTADEGMMSALLRVLTPLPESARLIVVSALQEAAMADDRAIKLLEECQEDTDSSIASEGIFGWMESLAARGAIAPENVDAMAQALHTVGPDYDERRAAAVIALAMAGRLDRFAEATEEKGVPLKVRAASSSFRNDGRYLRRMLRFWPQLIEALGSEDAVIERLEMKAETILPLMNPNEPNAEIVFDILMKQVPESPHLAKHVQISALAQFAPRSHEMRALILTQLTDRVRGEYWGGLIAAEVFAEHFAEDAELTSHIMAEFNRNPAGIAAAALAELLLRKPDAEIERLLRENTAEISYDVASHFKLVAALSRPEQVVKALTHLLVKIPLEVHDLQLPRWVPTMVRRIEKDADVREALRATLAANSPPSVKASFTSLLGQGSGVDEKLQAFATTEVERLKNTSIPEVGFDLRAQAYRMVRHVLVEALV